MSQASITPPPFPKEKHWLFGNAYYLKKDTLHWFSKFADDNGDIYSVSMPFNRAVVITNPDYVRYILQDNSKNYYKSRAYDLLKLLLGNGLLTSEGEEWKQHRKMIQPAFHKGKLDDFVQVMKLSTDQLCHELDKIAGSNKSLEFTHQMSELALNIISKCMFGTGVDDKAPRVSDLITLLNTFAIDRLRRPFPVPNAVYQLFNFKEKGAVRELDDVIYDMIKHRREAEGPKDDLLGMLVFAKDEETGKGMDDIQLRDELMTIFVAGHETTANALAFAFYALAGNHEVRAKLMQELDGIAIEDISFDKLMQMPYLRGVVDETMRLYPSVWSIGRRNYQDDEIGGYHIQASTNVLVPIYHFHRNPKYWDDPLSFKPERFAPEKRNQIDRFVYMPFGGGARMCIGNHFALTEMMVVVAMLLKRYRFELLDIPPFEIEPLITLRTKHGVHFRFTKR